MASGAWFPGNLGERPPSPEDVDEDIAYFFEAWINHIRYKRQVDVYIDEVESICLGQNYSRVRLVHHLVRDAVSRLQLNRPFSKCMIGSLEEIMEQALRWGIDIDMDCVRKRYRKAQEDDEKERSRMVFREKSCEDQQVHTSKQRKSPYSIVKMPSEELPMGSLPEPFTVEDLTLYQIQFEIIYRTSPEEEPMMTPPDLWYLMEDRHRLTERGLRWSLANCDWKLDEDYNVDEQIPDVYFVDVDSYGGSGNYIVVLLHYSIGGKEYDEPISIPWGDCPENPECMTLNDHLRHLPATGLSTVFVARNMIEDDTRYIRPSDNGVYPGIANRSKELLRTTLCANQFEKRRNDLYLQCKYPDESRVVPCSRLKNLILGQQMNLPSHKPIP
ncbi:hypothetical protein CPB86DRAFT_830722 [Serendipita vermifera]|nr:hypothetical protein CPB86DRAFT_830722 [Serendipita vermifera]